MEHPIIEVRKKSGMKWIIITVCILVPVGIIILLIWKMAAKGKCIREVASQPDESMETTSSDGITQELTEEEMELCGGFCE